ncbi:MAG: FtsX-like permease family protein [Bacteroidales bacterium]
MIKFLLKGLVRDKSRSSIPLIVVTIGAMLTVILHAYMKGFMGDTIEMNARFNYGHLKVMTLPYSENISQLPNDLAILDAAKLQNELETLFPDAEWSQRIQFGGLIDSPDENGETKTQGPAMGMGLDLLSPEAAEPQRLNLEKSIVRGNMPGAPGEILLSDQFSRKLVVGPGDKVTFIGSTMNGSMSVYDFIVAGTLPFGTEALDRGTIIADIRDVQTALDMPDATGEIAGFFRTGFYDNESALDASEKFNSLHSGDKDEYRPVMKSLSQQGSMGQYVKMSDYWANYITVFFVFAMSLVLWNAGLLGGLRRYGEIGVRLAMGEEKGHVYRTMIFESVMIGLAGSVIGTLLGLLFAWLLQKYGVDFSGMMKTSSVMMPPTIKARITPPDFYIGFIPGLFSTVLGTMLSGRGIYKRQTARLFKELET